MPGDNDRAMACPQSSSGSGSGSFSDYSEAGFTHLILEETDAEEEFRPIYTPRV